MKLKLYAISIAGFENDTIACAAGYVWSESDADAIKAKADAFAKKRYPNATHVVTSVIATDVGLTAKDTLVQLKKSNGLGK